MELLPRQNWDKVEPKDPDSREIHEEVESPLDLLQHLKIG